MEPLFKVQTKSLILTAATLGALGLALAAYSHWRTAPAFELKPEQALGEVVAEETAKLMNQGGQILVIAGDAGDALLEAQVASFQTALQKYKLVKRVALERLKPIEPLLRTMNPGSPPYQPAEFDRALQGHPQVNGVVSFVGLPAEGSSAWAGLKAKGCKRVAIFNTTADAQVTRALEQRWADVAFVAREEAKPVGAAPLKTAREICDRYYVIATPP